MISCPPQIRSRGATDGGQGGRKDLGDIGEKTNSGLGEEPNRTTIDVRGQFSVVQRREGGVSRNCSLLCTGDSVMHAEVSLG